MSSKESITRQDYNISSGLFNKKRTFTGSQAGHAPQNEGQGTTYRRERRDRREKPKIENLSVLCVLGGKNRIDIPAFSVYSIIKQDRGPYSV